MANIPDTNTEDQLTNREITNIIRDLINSRPGLNRNVTSVAYDISASSADECVVVVRVSKSGIGYGGGNEQSVPPAALKSKIVGDEAFSESDGPGASDMVGMPQGDQAEP